MNPTVSVVIACYNGSEFLENCVLSVTNQNVDSEVIIVDDGSTDNSVEVALNIIRTQACRGILICQTNQGAAAARNAGMRAAAGKFLCFLDVDDELAPGALAAGIDALERDPAAVAAQGRIELVNLHRPVEEWQQRSMEATVPGNMVIHTEAARRMGGFPVDPAFRGKVGGEDGYFRVQLAEYGRIAQFDRVFLKYRVRPGSHTDYFLDRSIWRNGRIEFTEQSPEEKNGSLFAVFNRYADEVAGRVIDAANTTLRAEISAAVDLHRLGQQFNLIDGSIEPVEGFALYCLARRWPVRGSILLGGSAPDARAAGWLAAGCKSISSARLITSSPAAGRNLAASLVNVGLSEMLDADSSDTVKPAPAAEPAIRLLFLSSNPSDAIDATFPACSARLARHGLLILHGNSSDEAVTTLCQKLGRDGGNWKSVLLLHRLAVFQKIAAGGVA